MTAAYILVCDLGGTRLRVAVAAPDGSLQAKQVVPTPKDDPGALARTMCDVLDQHGEGVVGAVVGVPGPMDYAQGKPLKLPNLPDWEGHVSSSMLESELGIPVLMANDADLAALGEHRYGAGRGSRDMVYVTSSTGVGAGVILGGRLLHGRLSLAEIGHTIIDLAGHKTVEQLGSGTALSRLAGEDAAAVGARAVAGDADARALFSEVADSFAVGVFNLVHCFSPELVVVGGGMSRVGDLLLDPVRKALSECDDLCPASRAEVVPAQGDDDVGLRGGAAYWAESR
jgi:glucokinase